MIYALLCLLLSCGALVYADTPALNVVSVQLMKQSAPPCIREHETTVDTPEIKTLLATIAQRLQTNPITLSQADRIQQFTVLSNYQEQLATVPHTVAVCAAQRDLKDYTDQIHQLVYDKVLASLVKQQQDIENRFVEVQNPQRIKTYKSYRTLLSAFDLLYTTADQLKLVGTPTIKVVLDKNIQMLRVGLLDQEKRLITYTNTLFTTDYPRRMTESEQLIQQWSTDIEGVSIDRDEQKVMKKAKTAEQFLGAIGNSTNEQQPSFEQLILQRKQFITSPYWQKLKARLHTVPMIDQPGIQQIQVSADDRGMEQYVVERK